MKSGTIRWLWCNITLNIRAARMQEGDVEYACDSGTLLQLTCLLESQKNRKNSARFSLACELNLLTIPFSLIMGYMHKLNMLKAVFA